MAIKPLRPSYSVPTSVFIADHLRQPILISIDGGPPVPINGGNGSGSFDIPVGPSGVAAGTYGDSTNVGQFTVGADGRITFAQDVPIAFPPSDTQVIPLVTGVEPIELVSDGSGNLVLVPYMP